MTEHDKDDILAETGRCGEIEITWAMLDALSEVDVRTDDPHDDRGQMIAKIVSTVLAGSQDFGIKSVRAGDVAWPVKQYL